MTTEAADQGTLPSRESVEDALRRVTEGIRTPDLLDHNQAL